MGNEKLDALVGKVIASASIRGGVKDMFGDETDDKPFLDLHFDDGTMVAITSVYGSYTGKSEDEYPCFVLVGNIEKAPLE